MARPLLYVLMIVVSAAAIAGVLRLGASLPPPLTASAGIAADAALTKRDADRDDLSDPLGRLFLQLFVIIVVSRAVGHVFTRFGQPGVVGEMAAGILLGPSLFGFLAPEAFAFVFPARGDRLRRHDPRRAARADAGSPRLPPLDRRSHRQLQCRALAAALLRVHGRPHADERCMARPKAELPRDVVRCPTA